MPIDFNMSEIVILAVLAVILLGPDKLPEMARKVGRVVNYVRGIANDARGQLREQLGPEFDDVHLADLNPRSLIQKHVLTPAEAEVASVKAELEPIKQVLSSATAGTAAHASSSQAERAQPFGVPFDTEAT